MFCSIVRVTVVDRVRFKKLSQDIAEYPVTISLLEKGKFKFSTIDECYAFASLLSCAFPYERSLNADSLLFCC